MLPSPWVFQNSYSKFCPYDDLTNILMKASLANITIYMEVINTLRREETKLRIRTPGFQSWGWQFWLATLAMSLNLCESPFIYWKNEGAYNTPRVDGKKVKNLKML